MRALRRLCYIIVTSVCIAVSATAQNEAELERAYRLSAEAEEQYDAGDYAEAVRLGTEALELAKQYCDGNDEIYAVPLFNIIKYYVGLGDNEAIKKYGGEYLELVERNFGGESEYYAGALHVLSVYHYQTCNYEEAIRLGTDALKLRERVIGREHPKYVMSLNNLAIYNSERGNYAEAIRLGTEALEIQERVLGRETVGYATILSNLASYNLSLGNYAEAIRLETEAMEIKERVLGKEHPDYATSLNNMANYNSSLGNYAEAIRLGTEALEMQGQVLGKEHPEYALSLNNLASYNSSLGNYAEAIRLGTEALEMQGRVLGKERPEYALYLHNLAGYNAELGNYEEAIKLLTDALEIWERVLGREHPKYTTSLDYLAYNNLCLGNYAEAIRLGTEALEIWGRVSGRGHKDCVHSLNNLALINSRIGNYDEAIRLGAEAMEILERALGEEHPNYATALNNLADYNSGVGKLGEAIRLGTEALEIRGRVLGREHPDYIHALKSLAVYSFANKSVGKTKEYAKEATALLSGYIHRTFTSLSANERRNFWEKYKEWFETDIPLLTFIEGSRELVESGYDAALLAKGILLNSERDFAEFIAESKDDDAIETYNQLQMTRRQLARQYEKPIAERTLNTDSLERVAYRLEHHLLERSKVYGDYARNMSIGWREVQSRLGKRDVAIEFVTFRVNIEGEDRQVYAAYVIDSKMKRPVMVDLFEEKTLKEFDEPYSTPYMSMLVWEELDKYIKDAENIYFAPIGELYNIAIESMPHYKREGLMSEHHNMYRVSSTRQLAVIKDKGEIKSATLYGGLKYDTDNEALERDAERYPVEATRDFVWSSSMDSLNLRGGVGELPGTRVEVENIAGEMEQRSLRPDVYTGEAGTEGSFRALSGKRVNLMHIATHGFYWTESEVRRSMSLQFLRGADDAPRHAEDKALTRSGLLLTGANNVLTGKPLPENVPDGVLTAREISLLDLRGLDMVVLSACQTGLGEIAGDGVFGLQRGFKKAGANTLMMSLWKVDDRATQMLMTKFYEQLLSGRRKSESLAAAQKYVRDYEAQGDDGITKPYSDPKYWAAFILLDAIDN